MFYDNYIRLCNEIKKSPSAVAVEIGITKPAVNRWKKGGCPTDATLRRIADYFGVTTDDLIDEEQKKMPTQEGEHNRQDIVDAVMLADESVAEAIRRFLGLK